METARPRPWSVSGVFPAPGRLALVLSVLDGVDLRLLLDLPAHESGASGRQATTDDAARGAPGSSPEGAGPDGALDSLAQAIWNGTDGQVAPRNVMGYWDVAARYGLLAQGSDHRLHLTTRGRRAAGRPDGRVLRQVAGREGLAHLLCAVAAGATTLSALLPGWEAVLRDNPRFASPASWPRSLGQRVAALVHDGWLAAHGGHATRLEDEGGFRRREPAPAFIDLDGGLQPTARALTCPVVARARRPGTGADPQAPPPRAS